MASNLTSTNTSIVGNSYTNQNLEDLQKRVDQANKALVQYNTNAASDSDLRKRAESEYTPVYNAQIGEQQAARRTAESQRDERLAALGRQYEKNAQELGRSYDTQRATANNTMLARGMNNSSLALAMLNRVEDQRNRALADLQAEKTASETSAMNDYSNAVSAADAAIARLNSDRETNIDSRYQALKEAEQTRVMNATAAQNQLTQYIANLMVEIESLRQQGYSQYLTQQELAHQMGEGASSSGGGSSSGRGSSASAAAAAGTGSAKSGGTLEDMYSKGGQKNKMLSGMLTWLANAVNSGAGKLISSAGSSQKKNGAIQTRISNYDKLNKKQVRMTK